MIQTYNLQETDYRGERFADFATDPRQQRFTCLTKPEVIQEIHRAYLDAGADIVKRILLMVLASHKVTTRSNQSQPKSILQARNWPEKLPINIPLKILTNPDLSLAC